MPPIAVLGSANMDLVVRQPRAARPGETIFGTDFTTGPGGKGLNQAVAAARAGADVIFLGAIGADEFGRRLRHLLADEGIDTTLVRTLSSSTGIAAITVTDDGENAIVVVSGANADATFDDDDRAAVAAASHLVVQLERPLHLVAEALATARAAGVPTILTPAPVAPGATDLLDLVDILVLNEHETHALSGESDVRVGAAVLSRRARWVVATLGPDGALLARAGDVVAVIPAHPTSVVDTTGAGDTFVGVMVAWLAGGADLAAALEAASAAAAIAVSLPGAATAMPRRSEILPHLHGEQTP